MKFRKQCPWCKQTVFRWWFHWCDLGGSRVERPIGDQGGRGDER